MAQPTRRSFNRSLTGLGAAALSAAAQQTSAGRARPNFLFLCSDQHSFQYTGYAGHPLVQTPHLDRIARQGVVFTNAYTGAPVCVPGRACMMTGMYASDCNSFCNSTVWDGKHPTWGTRLKRAGYETRATGKLDLNDDFDMGFHEIETGHGHRHGPDITSLFRRPVAYRLGERDGVDGRPREKRHQDARRAEVALEFLRGNARNLDRPWVQYVGFTQPHPAFVALQRYWEMYPAAALDLPVIPEGYLENQHLVFQELRHFKRIATPIPEERIRRARAGYYGMITELDEYIGQLWEALEATGQLENTVVIYTSDHGEALGDHGLWYKNNLLDPAARVPLVMAGGGLPRGKTVHTPVAHVDVIATMLEMAGAEGVAELRGHSLLPLLRGEPGDHPGFAYSESHSEGNATGSFLIRKGDWKYIHCTWYGDLLFNLAEDPGEFRNRIDEPGAQGARREMEEILRSQVDPEEVTRRGFAAQERMLADFARQKSETELAGMFEGRMGKGLARVLASRAKSQRS
jgi:choline-sulfatase